MRVGLVLLVLMTTSEGAAQRTFDARWREAGPVDWVATGVGALGALTIALAVDTDQPWWQRQGPLDELLVPRENAQRQRRAGLASDVLGLLALAPSVVDPLLGFADERQLGRELSMMTLRSFSLTALAVTATKYGFRRQRPGCVGLAPTTEVPQRCHRASANRSFISGHAAMVWTSAALMCVAHRHLRLYRSGAADATGCALTVGLATTTSILRMIAKRHHFTDVLMGAILGLLSGWVLPAVATFGFGR